MPDSCSRMIIGLACWEFFAVMTVIIVLLMVPVLSWIIHRRLKNKKANTDSVPPLMYITAVSTTRTSDVDIPHLPSPGEANFLPPSYEDIIKGADTQNHLSVSPVSIEIDDELPEYASIASQRGSMMLSTFYSDGNSSRASASLSSENDSESDSEGEQQQTSSGRDQRLSLSDRHSGVFVA